MRIFIFFMLILLLSEFYTELKMIATRNFKKEYDLQTICLSTIFSIGAIIWAMWLLWGDTLCQQ